MLCVQEQSSIDNHQQSVANGAKSINCPLDSQD